jgi:hypothetical protein
MGVKLSNEQFIERSNKIHNNFFIYEKLQYKGLKDKVIITCPIHGDFNVSASSHLAGSKCPLCSSKPRPENPIKYFTEKAAVIHENQYDYSMIKEWKGVMEKYTIICPEHGPWDVTMDNHINKKSKCPKCVGRNWTYLEKISQATKIHGGKYDYSLIKKDFSTMDVVPIICPEHGVFNQLWCNHIHQQHNCPQCATYGKKKIPVEEIKRRVLELETGFEYNWDSFTGYYDNMDMKCPIHGWFKQSISNHLFGQRCPVCKNSKGEETIRKFLLDNNIEFISQKTFDGCRNPKTNYRLKFDFYIPSINLCIEYDGELHYRPIKFFGGQKEYEKSLILDEIKNKFCEQNDINLLRISYMEFKSINNILTKLL